ncbi:MAG: hypothetical protein EXS05_20735 [Planctomycetaceae bacterium]|nr:hypothetical protein [Planctomycetaceae bacterium]
MNFDMTIDRQTHSNESFPDSDTMHDGPRCLRCCGALREGFLAEQQHSFEPAAATTWHAGPTHASHWTGVQVEAGQQRPVLARRCDRCGGLELFAP